MIKSALKQRAIALILSLTFVVLLFEVLLLAQSNRLLLLENCRLKGRQDFLVPNHNSLGETGAQSTPEHFENR